VNEDMPDQETTEFLEKRWKYGTSQVQREVIRAVVNFYGAAILEMHSRRNANRSRKGVFKWPRTAPDATEPAS
jgi:hypothetical protein